jgi:hypothetical protein
MAVWGRCDSRARPIAAPPEYAFSTGGLDDGRPQEQRRAHPGHERKAIYLGKRPLKTPVFCVRKLNMHHRAGANLRAVAARSLAREPEAERQLGTAEPNFTSMEISHGALFFPGQLPRHHCERRYR